MPFALLLVLALVLQAPAVSDETFVGSPEVARQLDRLAAAIEDGSADEATLSRGVDELNALTDGDRARLLLELAEWLSRSEGTEQAMSGALVLEALALSPDEVVAAVVPQLSRGDWHVERVYRQLLEQAEAGSLLVYVEYLRACPDCLTPALVHYLYDRDTPRAVGVLSQAEKATPAVERERVELARRLVAGDGERRAATAVLAGESRWWLRLLAARTLAADGGGADATLVSALRDDPHSAVREALSRR